MAATPFTFGTPMRDHGVSALRRSRSCSLVTRTTVMSENDNFQSVRLEYARQLDVVRGALHRQLGVMVSNNSVAHLVADSASKGQMQNSKRPTLRRSDSTIERTTMTEKTSFPTIP